MTILNIVGAWGKRNPQTMNVQPQGKHFLEKDCWRQVTLKRRKFAAFIKRAAFCYDIKLDGAEWGY